MKDENAKTQSQTRILRSILLAVAVFFLAVSAAVLLRPLDVSQVPKWNVLIHGYTVVGLLMAFVSLVMALALGMIALSATHAKMTKRLKGFLVLTATSFVCLIVVDLLLPLLTPLACFDDPAIANILGARGTIFVVNEKYGIRYRCNSVIDSLRNSDLIANHEAMKPTSIDEPENGMRLRCKIDRNGFVNDSVPDECDIFVVGDSYANPPIPHSYYWTSLLKQKTAKTVYNAGTASYSFQQELLVMREYGYDMKPKTIIWGYFQGNDLQEAENFDRFQKSGLLWRDYWRKAYGLDDQPFPYNRPFVRLLLAQAGRLGYVSADLVGREYQVPCEVAAADKSKTYFFFRNYMASASRSREDILKSRGWEICRESLLAAKAECDKIGARLVIAYFPSKITVFFEQMENEYDWEVYYRYLCHENIHVKDARQARETLRDNRYVQCELLKEFCQKEGIDLVDTTPPLKDAAQQGRWPYFSYDTHLNIEGNRIVAETLAKYLSQN